MTVKPDPLKLREYEEKIRRLEENGVIAAECRDCEMIVFLAGSNLGDLRCPHCFHPTLVRWGKAKINFRPEQEQ